jgi:hypothetical protein
MQMSIAFSSGEWDFAVSSTILLVSLFYLYKKFEWKYFWPSRSMKSYFSFGIIISLLIWPNIHMALSNRGDFSSWRFFGWGMYATPHPEDGVVTDIIFHSKKKFPLIKNDSKGNNLPGVRLFVFDGEKLQKITGENYLLKKMIKVANTYFLHIPNEKHRKKLVEIALNFLKLDRANFKGAGLIKNRQRVNLHENQLYTEEISYKVKF